MSFDDVIRTDDVETQLIVTMATIVNEVETAKDISGATTKELDIQKPNGEILDPVTATFLTDGTDGILTYTTATAIFDTIGRWKVRGVITTSSQILHGSWTGFTVAE